MFEACQLTLSYQGSYCSTTGRLLVHIPNTDFVYTEGTDNLSVCLYPYISEEKKITSFEFYMSHCSMTDSSYPRHTTGDPNQSKLHFARPVEYK